jgi:hypothetical protein
MFLLIDYLSSFFNCERNDLARILRNTSERKRLINKLQGHEVRTTYRNHEERAANFEIYDLTIKPANEQYAYNGFMRTTV